MNNLVKFFSKFFVILIITSLVISAKEDPKLPASKKDNILPPVTTEADVNLFFENWEGGIGNWQSFDETGIPPQWKLRTFSAFGGSGLSWHCADTTLGTNGGYNNSWYQVIDTDPINLTGTNPQLTYQQRYNVEAPGGEPAGYNGWDGMNVRISTNNGTTWVVLTNPTPAYTSTSLYSFGFEHGEGTNIPGWAGVNETWHQVTFDLTAYAGQSVKIRFAFASDPAYATGQQGGSPAMFGWQIDDILVSSSSGNLFSNNGTASGMTGSNWAATGEDLWRVATNGGFSGPNYASCNNLQNTYVPNMRNSIISEYFYIPTQAVNVFMDFYVRGSWVDNDVFPNVDYFGAYVQVQGESDRRYVSNITQDPNGSNFVYSNAPETWSAFSLTYSVGLISLNTLKGNWVRVIFDFRSDEDAPLGAAIQIDDVRIWADQIVPVELSSFTGLQNGSSVLLNWSTATETNNQGFEVQRKIINGNESTDWNVIAFKNGFGTTTAPQEYTYLDDISGINATSLQYRLKQVDLDGNYEYSQTVLIENLAPVEYAISQNYPNPFNPSTKISYSIPNKEFVNISVYNLLGEKIAVLVNEIKEAGNYEINFDANQLTSGIYLYKIEAGSFVQTNKMTLLR